MSTNVSPAAGEFRPPFRIRCKQLWSAFASWCARQWSRIRPGPEARRGAVWGTLAAAALSVVIAAVCMHTGFGYAFDFAFAVVAAALVVPVTALLVALLLTIARKLPRFATGMIVGSCSVIMLAWFVPEIGIPFAVLGGLAAGFLGATVATFVTGEFARAAVPKKIITAVLFTGALGANIYYAWFFANQGSLDELVSWRPPTGSMPPVLAAPDPSQPGPYRVRALFYGAGNDRRRPEYGPSVAIRTRTVNATDFFKDFKGWKRWARRRYWGFDFDKIPLNARVWYPEGSGPFPLVLIVHGNHNMADFSDPGYAYLGELLASRGFILASVDENFLNSGLFHDPPKQEPVRGWLLLEHLKLWREWNHSRGNPFHSKIDMDRIALMGHSRGGEAAATAAFFNRIEFYPDNAAIRFDYGFRIKAVVAIAPADGQYKPAGQHRWLQDVSYLTLQGAHDSDVSSFLGSRQWDHVRYTSPGPWFKAEVYAYRANHGQFNTVWGRTDAGPPFSWLLNLKPLLRPEDQRRIAKAYISAFLETTLHDRHEYLPLFQDWRVARAWLPDTLYINRYQDASYVTVTSFEEDADITTTTAPGGRIAGDGLSIWREGRIPWRRGDRDYNGVFLGWNRAKNAPAASYTLTLPENFAAALRLKANSVLELSVAALDEDAPLPGKKDDKKESAAGEEEREAPDFTVELATRTRTASVPVSRFAAIPPPLREKFTKLSFIESRQYEKDTEPVFQTVRIPLCAFPLDVTQIATIRLKFDRTKTAVVCISSIGFGAR